MAGEQGTNPSQGVQAPQSFQAPKGVQAFKAYLESSNAPTDVADELQQEETSDVVEDQVTDDQPTDESLVNQDQGDDQQLNDEGADTPVTDIKAAKVTALIDGIEQEITVDEAIQGYQRSADYTRKTQEIARTRTELTSTIQSYQQGLELIGKYFTADVEAFKTLDWDAIKAADPGKWTSLKIEQQEAQERARSLQAAFQEAEQLRQQQVMQDILDRRPVEYQALVTALPELKDPKKQQETYKSWMDYGQTQGFTQDELGTIIDHRMLVVLDKAYKYDQLQAKQKDVINKKVTQNPKVIRRDGTAANNPGDKPDRDYSKAMDNLRATGSKSAGIEVFKQRLTRGN